MRMMFVAALLAVAPLAVAQTATTRPSAVPPAAEASAASSLEVRATQAFNAGNYSQALPMLEQLAGQLKDAPDQADKFAMVQEQVRVCKKNANGVSAGKVTAAAAVKDDRKPHAAPKSGEVQEMTIKELGNFEYDPDQNTPIPDDVKALNGSTVRLHGFMIPLDQAENVSRFALVPSLFNCCFGQAPQMQHTIIVNCPKGKAVSYYPDEIIVEGKLKVDVLKDEGYIIGIFALEPSSIKPANK